MKVSWAASRASSSRPSIPKQSANIFRSHLLTISPKASEFLERANSTSFSSVKSVNIKLDCGRTSAGILPQNIRNHSRSQQLDAASKRKVENIVCAGCGKEEFSCVAV